MKSTKAVLALSVVLIMFFLFSQAHAADAFLSDDVGMLNSSAAGSYKRPILVEADKDSFDVFPGCGQSGINYGNEVWVSFGGLYIGTSERNEVILEDPNTRKQKIVGFTHPNFAEKKKQYQTVFFPEGKEITTSWQFYFAAKPETEDHVLKIKFKDEGAWYQYQYPFQTKDVQAIVEVANCVEGISEFVLVVYFEPFFGSQIAAGNTVTLDIEGRLLFTEVMNEAWGEKRGCYVPWYNINHLFTPAEISLIEGVRTITLGINNGTQIFKTTAKVNFNRCQ
jgi:hypothetical protein